VLADGQSLVVLDSVIQAKKHHPGDQNLLAVDLVLRKIK
jgi:hypothetical protein